MTETTETPDAASTRIRPALLLTLALLAAVAPFAIDLYLSSLPRMMTELHTTTTGVQLSLTAFLVGAGLGQLIFGPLSDRLGRTRPLLVGMSVYLVASVVAVIAPNIGVLIAARLVQGIAGASGMVISRAIIADLTRGVAAARALSLMMLVTGIAPIAAPFVGGLLSEAIGWRGLLGIVAGLGAFALPLILLFVRETHGPEARAAAAARRADHTVGGLASRGYLGYLLTFGFAFATLMAYIAASPFVYQTMIGLNEVGYGIAFAVNAIGLSVFGALNARLVGRFRPEALLRVGLTMNLIGVVAVLLIALSGLPPIWLAPAVLVVVSSLGFIMGNATALALDAVPGRGGAASAGLGALQFTLAGVVSALVGLGGESTAVPLGIVMVVASLIANTASLVVRRR